MSRCFDWICAVTLGYILVSLHAMLWRSWCRDPDGGLIAWVATFNALVATIVYVIGVYGLWRSPS